MTTFTAPGWSDIQPYFQLTWALLDPTELTLLAFDPLWLMWFALDATVQGQPADAVLPELWGLAEQIQALPHSADHLRLDLLQRQGSDGRWRYLNVVLLPTAERHILLVAQDSTAQGRTLQALTQNRNELRLLRQQLDTLNQKLFYLLNVYLPPTVADQLVRGELAAELGGQQRQVAILFADIRGYTRTVERLTPDQTMQTLNAHLTAAVQAITEHGGTVNQFQGDNVMAIFNAPLDLPAYARHAVQAALAVHAAVADYHHSLPADQPRLQFGIGINTGPALVGNSGGGLRYTYTAIGDTVNLASRITAVTPAGQVWITEPVLQQVQAVIRTTPLKPLLFKGKSAPTALFAAHDGDQP